MRATIVATIVLVSAARSAAAAHWSAVSEPSGFAPIDLYLTGANALYAGTDEGRVFATTNGGQTWTEVGDDLGSDYAPVESMAISGPWFLMSRMGPVAELNVRSHFDGTTWAPWEALPEQSGPIRSLSVIGDHIFGLLPGSGLVRSDDFGSTWTPVPSGSVGQLFAEEGRLYTAGGGIGSGDLRRSDDLGQTWTTITGPIASSYVCSHAVFRGQLLVCVYHGGGIGVTWRTNDHGASWTRLTSLPTTANLNGMTVTGDDRFVIGASGTSGSSGTIFVTADLASWTDETGDLPTFAKPVNQLVAFDGTLFKTGGSVTSYASELPTTVAVEPEVSVSPLRLTVSPNPARRSTTLWLEVGASDDVRLSIYDSVGRRVQTLSAGSLPAGRHAIRWDGRDAAGRDVPAGTYVVEVTSATIRGERKVTIVR